MNDICKRCFSPTLGEFLCAVYPKSASFLNLFSLKDIECGMWGLLYMKKSLMELCNYCLKVQHYVQLIVCTCAFILLSSRLY